MESLEEKEYLNKLIKELKKFLVLNDEEKNYAAIKLEEKFVLKEENKDFSERTIEITSSLQILHHYEEDPEGYTYMVSNILDEAREQLKIISPEEENEEKEIEEQDEREKELEDEEDEDYEEKFIVSG